MNIRSQSASENGHSARKVGRAPGSGGQAGSHDAETPLQTPGGYAGGYDSLTVHNGDFFRQNKPML